MKNYLIEALPLGENSIAEEYARHDGKQKDERGIALVREIVQQINAAYFAGVEAGRKTI